MAYVYVILETCARAYLLFRKKKRDMQSVSCFGVSGDARDSSDTRAAGTAFYECAALHTCLGYVPEHDGNAHDA